MRQTVNWLLLKQLASFSMVGLMNTGLDIGVFWILTRLTEMPPIPANVVSFLFGSLNSYLLNGLVTFSSHGVRLIDLGRISRFALVTMVCLIISSLCLALALPQVPDLVAKLVAAAATLVAGFVLNRLLVFKLAAS